MELSTGLHRSACAFTRGTSCCLSQGQRQGEPWGASPRPGAPTYLPTSYTQRSQGHGLEPSPGMVREGGNLFLAEGAPHLVLGEDLTVLHPIIQPLLPVGFDTVGKHRQADRYHWA